LICEVYGVGNGNETVDYFLYMIKESLMQYFYF